MRGDQRVVRRLELHDRAAPHVGRDGLGDSARDVGAASAEDRGDRRGQPAERLGGVTLGQGSADVADVGDRARHHEVAERIGQARECAGTEPVIDHPAHRLGVTALDAGHVALEERVGGPVGLGVAGRQQHRHRDRLQQHQRVDRHSRPQGERERDHAAVRVPRHHRRAAGRPHELFDQLGGVRWIRRGIRRGRSRGTVAGQIGRDHAIARGQPLAHALPRLAVAGRAVNQQRDGPGAVVLVAHGPIGEAQ